MKPGQNSGSEIDPELGTHGRAAGECPSNASIQAAAGSVFPELGTSLKSTHWASEKCISPSEDNGIKQQTKHQIIDETGSW